MPFSMTMDATNAWYAMSFLIYFAMTHYTFMFISDTDTSKPEECVKTLMWFEICTRFLVFW